MKKTMNIDLGSDRLIAIAADMLDEHNYIGALKMLNKNAELWGDDPDSLMLYAEAFDDMELNEKCINGWFRFLDSGVDDNDEDLSDCYEGLAVAYMNEGMEHYAAYYYDKMLSVDDEADDVDRQEIVRSLLTNEPDPLKVAYPPEEADCTDALSDGVEYMKKGATKEAISSFSTVPEGNPAYLSARNYIAMCYILEEKNDEAEEECLRLIQKYPDDVNALTTLAAVKIERAGEYARSDNPDDAVKAINARIESRQVAEKLYSLDCDNPDDLYRIATVFCENKMHAEAYETFSRVLKERPYDVNLLYFIAISAFNSGKYSECFDAFDTLLTIRPEAAIAEYNYKLARKSYESGDKSEMSYFYTLPEKVRESSLKLLAAILKLSVAEGRELMKDIDVVSLLHWCFDETDVTGGKELCYIASEIAVKHRFDGFVRDILVDAFLPDELKIDVLTRLCMRNRDDEFGVVVCHIYKRVQLYKLTIGTLKRKNFLKAYSNLVGHFSLIESKLTAKFARAACAVYSSLEKRGELSLSDDQSALAAAIFKKSGAGKTVKINDVEKFFSVGTQKISAILGEV